MRLIDIDVFREENKFAEKCADCKRNYKWKCDMQMYSACDICGWLDDAEIMGGVEPSRLLTLEEALSSDECWIEGRNGACGYGDALLTDDAERVDFFRPHSIATLDFYAYGSEWRCWSYKPTDEQRKAVKWDDPGEEDEEGRERGER